ncbi:hypothetical protein MASR2M70_03540 [Bacillota bacterium]
MEVRDLLGKRINIETDEKELDQEIVELIIRTKDGDIRFNVEELTDCKEDLETLGYSFETGI